ncbi:hypothetical protein FOFC_08007 [Fusarium oxysporum]|nr:hypothetical protein FOFC_08007 [Fusarium oxysporum]
MFGAWGIEIICKVLTDTKIPDDPSETIHTLKALESSPPTFFANILMPLLQTFKLRTSIPGPLGHAYRAFAEWERRTASMLKTFQNQSRDPDEKRQFGAASLLDADNKHLGRKFQFREALEEAMGILLAGSGVSGHTFLYLTYALARPEGRRIQGRLRKELEGAGDSLSELTALPYLSAVIKETYRVFPAIMSTLPRILGQSLEVVDTDIILPPGTVVGMQNYVHHRDPVLFPKPDMFIPERWLEGHELNQDINLHDANAALTPYSVAVWKVKRGAMDAVADSIVANPENLSPQDSSTRKSGRPRKLTAKRMENLSGNVGIVMQALIREVRDETMKQMAKAQQETVKEITTSHERIIETLWNAWKKEQQALKKMIEGQEKAIRQLQKDIQGIQAQAAQERKLMQEQIDELKRM